jgi:hypothetical protein
MLNRRFHCRQGSVIGEFSLAVLAPVTLNALKSAKFNYVWRLAIFARDIIYHAYLFGYVECRIGYRVLFLTHLRQHHLLYLRAIL